MGGRRRAVRRHAGSRAGPSAARRRVRPHLRPFNRRPRLVPFPTARTNDRGATAPASTSTTRTRSALAPGYPPHDVGLTTVGTPLHEACRHAIAPPLEVAPTGTAVSPACWLVPRRTLCGVLIPATLSPPYPEAGAPQPCTLRWSPFPRRPLLLEHEPVYTAGNGRVLGAADDGRRSSTSTSAEITWHGPWQIRTRSCGRDPPHGVAYVLRLGQLLIDVCTVSASDRNRVEGAAACVRRWCPQGGRHRIRVARVRCRSPSTATLL